MRTIIQNFRNNGLIIIGIISLLFCFYYVDSYRWKDWNGEGYKQVINSDGRGYYAYLPALFIHGNLDWNFLYHGKSKEIIENQHDFIKDYKDKKINKYFIGVSLLLSPFFILAYFISYIIDYELTGYTMVFQKMVSIGALFYLFLGLLYICKTLRLFNLSNMVISISFLVLLFGTNLF
jgi:hypothetical protein